MTSRVPGGGEGLTSLGYFCGYMPPDVFGVLEVLFYNRFFYIRVDRVLNMRCHFGGFTSLVGKSIPGYNFLTKTLPKQVYNRRID